MPFIEDPLDPRTASKKDACMACGTVQSVKKLRPSMPGQTGMVCTDEKKCKARAAKGWGK